MQLFKNILLVLDGAQFSGQAAQLAVELANANNGFLTVVDVLGNTSEEILNQIDSSVLAVKPAGFISPVTILVGT